MPNDPRGSGSHGVATPLLAELGELHYGRRRVQPSPSTVREFYKHAEERLLFPVIHFDQQQIDLIGAAFSEAIQRHSYTCYACAIMPDHVHIVIRKHRRRAEAMIDNLQAASRLRLSNTGELPRNHPVWTLGGWKRFLDSPSDMRGAIGYVERNPPKSGLPRQSWPIVTSCDRWPFYPRDDRL